MADDKAKPAEQQDLLVEMVTLLFTIFLIASVFNAVLEVLNIDKIFSGTFSSGLSGFTEKNLVLKNTRPLSSVLNSVGSNIKVSSKEAFIYGDDLVTRYGKQGFGSVGKVIKGPVSFLGNKMFFVDFKKGYDGFVKEDDLAYIESDSGIITKIILTFYRILNIFWYSIAVLAAILLLWIIYLFRNLSKIRENVKENLFPSVIEEKAKINQNPKWEKVLVHLESNNQADWRLSIIEADILLSELLDKMNLFGESIGDKLKSVEKSDFVTIDLAWEAHKVRNRIAHDGSDFNLTQKEARRVISLYEEVFKEFSFI